MGWVDALIGGAVSALGGAASSGLSYAENKKLMEQQNKYNVQNASTAQGYALLQQDNSARLQYENWRRQFADENERQNYLLQHQKAMEYSALKNAGLNPALAGGAVSNVAVSNPSASAPTGSGPMGQTGLAHADVPDMGSNIANGANSFGLIKEKAQNMRADTLSSIEDVLNKRAFRDPQVKAILQHTATEYSQQLLNEANANRVNTLTPLEANKIVADTHYISEQQKALAAKWPQELQLLYAQTLETLQAAKTSKAQEGLYRAQTTTEGYKQKELAASAQYYFKQCQVCDKNISYLSELIGKTKEEKDLIKNEAFEALQEGRLKAYAADKAYSIPPTVQRYLDMAETAWNNMVDGVSAVVPFASSRVRADATVQSAQIRRMPTKRKKE